MITYSCIGTLQDQLYLQPAMYIAIVTNNCRRIVDKKGDKMEI